MWLRRFLTLYWRYSSTEWTYYVEYLWRGGAIQKQGQERWLAYECQTYVWRESGCHNLSRTATAVGRMSRRTKDLHSFAIHNPTNNRRKPNSSVHINPVVLLLWNWLNNSHHARRPLNFIHTAAPEHHRWLSVPVSTQWPYAVSCSRVHLFPQALSWLLPYHHRGHHCRRILYPYSTFSHKQTRLTHLYVSHQNHARKMIVDVPTLSSSRITKIMCDFLRIMGTVCFVSSTTPAGVRVAQSSGFITESWQETKQTRTFALLKLNILRIQSCVRPWKWRSFRLCTCIVRARVRSQTWRADHLSSKMW